jgi:hypothetical protein
MLHINRNATRTGIYSELNPDGHYSAYVSVVLNMRTRSRRSAKHGEFTADRLRSIVDWSRTD